MFSKKKDPKEQMRQQKRELNKTQRQLARDQTALERQEKQLEAEIKKMAKLGNKQAATTLAKQLVNLRKQKGKNMVVSSRVMAIGHQTQTMHSTAKMAGAMSTASKTMGSVNAQMNPAQLQNTLKNFEMESSKMDMKEEMINETLDSILDESGDEEEQEAIVNQVLDEIGIEVSGRMAEAPSAHAGKLPTGQRVTTKGSSDAEIEEMLAKLRA
ncbi:charged multivesicular body protein 2b-like [Montipora capricornis]|uniref:charged multivesicular body protein 2b-like n=1 Tax=Montipora foliosa TaxID=591990 RepID=UPI0035F12E6A